MASALTARLQSLCFTKTVAQCYQLGDAGSEIVLDDKGDLDGVLLYAQRALKISEDLYGSDDPKVAISTSNVGFILKDKGDLDGALR